MDSRIEVSESFSNGVPSSSTHHEASLFDKLKSRRKNLASTNYSLNLDLSNILRENHFGNKAFRSTSHSALGPLVENQSLELSSPSSDTFQMQFDPYHTVPDSWLYKDMSPQNSPNYYSTSEMRSHSENFSPKFEVSPNVPFTPFLNEIFNFDFPQKDSKDPNSGSSPYSSFGDITRFSSFTQGPQQPSLSSTVGYGRNLSKTTNFTSNRRLGNLQQFSRSETSVGLMKKLDGANTQSVRPKPYNAIGSERSWHERQRRQESLSNAQQVLKDHYESSNQKDSKESNDQLLDRLYNMFYEKYTAKRNFKECQFCRRNGASFIDHEMKDNEGNVICPVLFRFVCKMCGATGSKAHTHKYCKNNHFTKGDPVAAGMPPGRPPVNSMKPKHTVDPKIDLADIYRIRRNRNSRSSEKDE